LEWNDLPVSAYSRIKSELNFTNSLPGDIQGGNRLEYHVRSYTSRRGNNYIFTLYKLTTN